MILLDTKRLAEMQLRILWEERLARDMRVQVMADPEYVASPFVKGYLSLPVRIAG